MEAPGHNHRVYQFAGFTLELGAGTLRAGDAPIPLRPKSFEVLRYLVEHAGLLATKEEMLQAIWGHQHVSDGSLAQCIIDIRKALGDTDQKLVRNVPRRGYTLCADVVVQEPRKAVKVPVEAAGAPSAEPRPRPGHNRRLARIMTVTALLLVLIASVELFIAGGYSSRARPAVAAAKPGDKSIAVLPFLDLSAKADQSWFAEGLSEEILNSLSQYPDMHVIARTSSFSLKDSKLDVPAVGHRLGVAYVLEGSVRQAGRTVRITAQLVRASDGTHLWSQTYDRQLGNILQLQSEIAAAVADSLEAKLIAKKPAAEVKPDAYEAYLQAQYFYNRRNPGDLERARKYYHRAIARDPGLARAWVGLSGLDNLLIGTGLDTRKSVFDEQLAAAQKGVELDPASAVAHLRLGQAYYLNGRTRQAYAQWDKAAALNNDDPMVLAALAGAALNNFQFDKAVRLQRRAAAADPISPMQRANLAEFLFYAGRPEEALPVYQQSIDLNPVSPGQYRLGMAQALVMLGQYREALKIADAMPEGPRRDQLRAMALGKLGRAKEAQSALRDLQSGHSPAALALSAQYFAWSGDLDRAFTLLDTCLQQCWDSNTYLYGQPWISELVISPQLSKMRRDPRWHDWYRRYNATLTEYYRALISRSASARTEGDAG